MASLEFDRRRDVYRFRFGGRDFNRSLFTSNRRYAEGTLARVRETLMLIESGRLDFPADADPAEFVLSDSMRPAAVGKQQELTSHLATNLVIEGDAERLRQVVLNLLDNAIKFTPPSGRIQISLEKSDGDAVMRVRDTIHLASGHLSGDRPSTEFEQTRNRSSQVGSGSTTRNSAPLPGSAHLWREGRM